jgi:hypothetical protein
MGGDLDVSAALGRLKPSRRAHSETVGHRVAAAARDYAPEHVEVARLAGRLHDCVYATDWVAEVIGEAQVLGFHPVDGARALAALGVEPLVCHLVAFHTAAPCEAKARNLDPEIFTPFASPADSAMARRLLSLLTWADLTTSPIGEQVTVRQRLQEILHRYPADSPVHRYITEHRQWLLAAGADPLGLEGLEGLEDS